MKPEILTCTGRLVPLNEDFEPDIGEIALALSRIPRFTGHTHDGAHAYSVAQHSVMVSHTVPYDFRRQGLLHDATEAYLGDIATPLKNLLPDYRNIERRMQCMFERHFGCPSFSHPEVKKADLILLATEWRDLMRGDDHALGLPKGIYPLPEKIVPWSQAMAERMFLDRFADLFGA
jgi:5'-deoxynucleotidase YfbR-like HD superfamily hydrolase